MLRERAAETGCTFVYVNQVGGQDELVFDGASLVVGPDGRVLAAAGQFTEELLLVDLEIPTGDGPPVPVAAAPTAPAVPDDGGLDPDGGGL